MMRLQDFMNTEVHTISAQETAETAYQRMLRHNIHHLVVMDGGAINGILSIGDLGGVNEEAQRQKMLVSHAMAKSVVTATPETTLREAANLMRGCTIGCLPVVEDDKLVGIITTTDLLELIGRGIERIVADTEKRPISREHPGKKQPGFNPGLGKT
jgi:acetoin utilization protein AcuB